MCNKCANDSDHGGQVFTLEHIVVAYDLSEHTVVWSDMVQIKIKHSNLYSKFSQKQKNKLKDPWEGKSKQRQTNKNRTEPLKTTNLETNRMNKGGNKE